MVDNMVCLYEDMLLSRFDVGRQNDTVPKPDINPTSNPGTAIG
jgi:hypothetical protein